MTRISGWGRYPVIDAKITTFDQNKPCDASSIPRGMGRSYGDSALADNIISMQRQDYFIELDHNNGQICCQAGVTLDQILQVTVPKGWFLPVTPGTKFISLGGAIASDVHGKNHHIDGCFSEFVDSLELVMANGDTSHCSRTSNPELFYATCGGMGLTGIIASARLRLRAISSSYLTETIHKTSNLQQTLELFETLESSTYSVAWIDCLAKGNQLGRSLLMAAEHEEQGGFVVHSSPKLSIPVNTPSFLLNTYSVKAFNFLYYNKQRAIQKTHTVHYDPFFYPLDSINQWNKLYGKSGFLQYQFVVPKEGGLDSMTEILRLIAKSGKGSFLAVLKAFGKQNSNYLSFPIQGYTLALDFKFEPNLLPFLEQLDQLVLAAKGRIYLAKDARISETTFKQSYPNWEKFAQLRQDTGADKHFNSLQSQRLGL